MKKIWMLCALLMLCGVLAACGDDDFRLEVIPSQVESALGTPEPESGGERLWIVTNLGKSYAHEGNQYSDGQLGGQIDLEFVIDSFGGLPGGREVELEVLPIDDEDLNARISRLKVEIMSGGGPDVFIMSSGYPMPEAYCNQPQIFQNPDKALHGNFFLPLDDYIPGARFMKYNEMNPAVLKAGQSEEGQMLLPMFHSINMGIAYTELDTKRFPRAWNPGVTENPEASAAYGEALRNGLFRSIVFADVGDFAQEEMLISEDELLEAVNTALTLSEGSFGENAPAEWFFDPFVLTGGSWEGERDPDYNETIFPLTNVDGSVTSRIDSYIAINRNTPYPDEAFALVDMLMSKEFLSLTPFWDGERMSRNGNIALFTELDGWGGLPIYDTMLENGDMVRLSRTRPLSRWQAYQEALSNLCVYLPSAVDTELESLFMNCKEAGGPEEIERLVKKAYTTMQMILGES